MSTRSYTKVARAAAEEQTHTALLDAAETAFYEEDWDAVSLEMIARRAGTTKQTLLRRFGSKEGLLEAAYARGFERVRTQRMEGPVNDIEAAVDTLLDHYAEHGTQALKISAAQGGRLAEWGQIGRQMHYTWVERAFARWLDAAPRAERDRLRALLIVICDVHSWDILANDLTFDRRAVRASLILAIRRLLQEEA
jgi:AcrR family transcriptional regulator